MSSEFEGITLSELARMVRRIETKQDAFLEQYVLRREWETRNGVVNDRFNDLGREIAADRKNVALEIQRIELNQKDKSARLIAIVSVGVAAAGFVVGLVQSVGGM